MDLGLAGIDAAAGVNFVARGFEQRYSFGERSGNLLAIDEGRCLCSLHGWVLRTGTRGIFRLGSASDQRVCARECELLILVCARCAAHSDTTNDLTVDYDWNPSDQWRESIYRRHGGAAFVD